MLSTSTINGNTCFNPDGMNMGVSDIDKCHSGSANYLYCNTTDSCITGTNCPECNRAGTSFCKSQLMCCDYECEIPLPTTNCTDVEFFNFGVNDKRCLVGELWCESMGGCINEMAICPYCPPGYAKYCAKGTDFADYMNKGQCCKPSSALQCMPKPATLPVASVDGDCRLIG